MDAVLLIARFALATVFVVAGTAKLMDPQGSRKAIQEFGVSARFASATGIGLPLLELGIALLLLPVSTSRWGALGALVLLLVFIAAIGVNLARGRTPDCHCFGQLHSEPAGPSTLVRNGGLAAVAAFVVIAGWSNPGASLADPFAGLSGGEAALLLGELLLLGLVTLLGWTVAQLMSQNGRLLARLDALEGSLARDGAVLASTQPAEPPRGLPVGTRAPDFTLPDLHGDAVSLASLRPAGSRLLLLFTDPDCGPCGYVLHHVTRWQEAAGDRLRIEVLSRGDLTANRTRAREHGLDRVLLQDGPGVAQAHAAMGTPSAVLVERDGTIGAPLAGGFEEIRDLVASLLGPAADPSLAPPQPALTGTAPAFQLTSLAGGQVSLDDLRARGLPVMLHFTDPRCGPCYELLPDIGGWHRVYGDRLTLAVVSNGSPATNRAMTAEYGIPAGRVVLQAEDEIFAAFQLRQMPAAIVIGADGEIQAEAAYGAHAVRALVAGTLGLALPETTHQQIQSAAIGDRAPVFRRPDVDGNPHEVGRRGEQSTILLFWNPGCPHCEKLLPEVKAWESQPDAPDFVVVSRGPVGLNRELGLRSPMVLDDDRSISMAYGATGTPAAVVIDSLGVIASDVGRGGTGVRALVADRRAVRTASRTDPGRLMSIDGSDHRDWRNGVPVNGTGPDGTPVR